MNRSPSMNRLSRLAPLVLAALVLLPLGAAAQEGPAAGTVIVVVHGPGGAAVADARVTLEGGDTSYSREAVTDAAGSVTLADVPLGSVAAKAFDAEGQLLASGVGYLEQAGEVITLIIGPEPAE